MAPIWRGQLPESIPHPFIEMGILRAWGDRSENAVKIAEEFDMPRGVHGVCYFR
jgi:hypothetical protein